MCIENSSAAAIFYCSACTQKGAVFDHPLDWQNSCFIIQLIHKLCRILARAVLRPKKRGGTCAESNAILRYRTVGIQKIKRLDDIFYRHAGFGYVQQPQLDPLVPPFGRISMGFLHLAGYCAASSYAYIFGNTAAGILLFLLCNRRCQHFFVFSNVLSSRCGRSPHICTAHQLGIGFAGDDVKWRRL